MPALNSSGTRCSCLSFCISYKDVPVELLDHCQALSLPCGFCIILGAKKELFQRHNLNFPRKKSKVQMVSPCGHSV